MTATVTPVDVTKSTISSTSAEAVFAITENTSTLNALFNNNTLSTGAGFFDFDFNQADASTVNVVDFPILSCNNNGASITTMGTINDILVLP
ncbi:MAG TPA: hypothetical protein DDW52_04865 [Planctomycetaceae bacterium]|nr:hypothetical protein [Planctomycetaceae bacterium]